MAARTGDLFRRWVVRVEERRRQKQPYFIHQADGQPIFMAAIGSTPFERGDDTEGFLIVTSAADKGLVDIRDRCPLVMSPEAAREWMRQDVGGKKLKR
jgi:putative SOS response-associated peptidase YedK